MTTRETHPVGRETVLDYAANELDLLRTKQKNGATYDLFKESTYNSSHQPLTVKDAAGQTTTYTYNAQGQLLTITSPPRAGITETRTTTYDYDEESPATVRREDLLGGVIAIAGTARRGASEVPFLAIPYFSWANRGPGEMVVWIPSEIPGTSR